MNWFEAFTVLDFETTSVNTDEAYAIEIGIVRFEQGREVAACNYLLCPYEGLVLHPKVTEITGIKTEDLYGHPTFAEVWPSVADLFTDAVPLAYNAPYDRRVFCNELRRYAAATPQLPATVLAAAHLSWEGAVWLDPLPYARHADRYQSGKKLTDCCKRRGIALDQAHRAIDDARATGLLWLALANELQIGSDVAAAAMRGEQFRVGEFVELQKYKARKDGQSQLAGSVYFCDVCSDTQWSEKDGKLPDGWATFRTPPDDTTFATCTAGCDAQRSWWRRANEATR